MPRIQGVGIVTWLPARPACRPRRACRRAVPQPHAQSAGAAEHPAAGTGRVSIVQSGLENGREGRAGSQQGGEWRHLASAMPAFKASSMPRRSFRKPRTGRTARGDTIDTIRAMLDEFIADVERRAQRRCSGRAAGIRPGASRVHGSGQRTADHWTPMPFRHHYQ